MSGLGLTLRNFERLDQTQTRKRQWIFYLNSGQYLKTETVLQPLQPCAPRSSQKRLHDALCSSMASQSNWAENRSAENKKVLTWARTVRCKWFLEEEKEEKRPVKWNMKESGTIVVTYCSHAIFMDSCKCVRVKNSIIIQSTTSTGDIKNMMFNLRREHVFWVTLIFSLHIKKKDCLTSSDILPHELTHVNVWKQCRTRDQTFCFEKTLARDFWNKVVRN